MAYFNLRWGVFICLFTGMLQMDLFHLPTQSIFDAGSIIEPDELDELYNQGNFEDLAKKVSLDSADYLRPNSEGVERTLEELMHNNGRGDMFLSMSQKQVLHGTGTNTGRVKRQGVKFINEYSPWPRAVPYAISKNFTQEHRKLIEDAIFQFNFRVQNEMLVPRITGQKDYLMFFDGEGCSSHVGRNGGPQVVTLSQTGCMEEGVIIHEIFHCLGMVHEHNRYDRDEYIRIKEENIPEDWKDQYLKYGDEVINLLGDYDVYSIMHYPLNAPMSKKPAIEVLDPGVDLSLVGQRKCMTKIDIQKLRKLYPYFFPDFFADSPDLFPDCIP